MSIRILPDSNAPTAAIELTLSRALADYDIEEVEMTIPRDVDGILVTQGFRDLVDDARVVLADLLSGTSLEIVQLTGAICPGQGVFRPGLWLVLRESGVLPNAPMSDQARARLATIANGLRSRLQLS
ncbi:MAG TPA: hypothetical protein VOA41_13455 [Candidatus Dormibacteraeota bacterium]|nr:hypothetical protein [Candidatus Dormibacteraeota bacterium]